VIQPTLGRIVWFTPSQHDKLVTENDGHCAAIVTKVWNERMVNLTVFDANGNSLPRTSVPLIQEGDIKPDGCCYCEWMPYQKGQAARAEALEKELAAKWVNDTEAQLASG